jgi:calreticulin
MDTRVYWGLLLVALCMLAQTSGKILFKEEFEEGWEKRWPKSQWKQEQQGEFVWTKGKWYGDPDLAYGIQTSQELKFYERATKLPIPITTGTNLFVLQYSVKFEQVIDCGGGYIKLVGPNYEETNFGGDTPLLIMFGPDICGTDNKVHLVLDHKTKGSLWKKKPMAPNDKLTHIYTLALYPNASYAVYLDTKPLENGTIANDWDFTVPRLIPDPKDKKPEVRTRVEG